jgi:hypothetical protein
MRGLRYPDWPRLMTLDVACAYLGGLDREAFLTDVAPATQPIKVRGGAMLFDRRELDAWVDARGDIAPKRSDDDWLREIDDAEH